MTEGASVGVVRRKGCNLHYWMSGPADGPVVALIHGAALDHTTFDKQVPVLVEHGCRVIAVDLRAHGRSKPIGSYFTVDTLVDDLLEVLEACGAQSVALVGHSLGGHVAQALLTSDAPRVRAMVLIGCVDMSQESSGWWRLAKPVLVWRLNRMPVEGYRRRTLARLTQSAEVRTWAAQTMAVLSRDEFRDVVLGGVQPLLFNRGYGPDYQVPTPFLLTHGANDKAKGALVQRRAADWAYRQPNCWYEVIPDAGHTAHMDNAPAFNDALLRFLASLT